MTDTTAKIRAKGLDATGVTEAIANQMYASKGAYYMAIVELKVDEVHEKADGTRRVDLILTQVEPSADTTLNEHLRELTRTLYYNRQTADGAQPTLDGDDTEPNVEDVLAAGARHRPHPYLSSQLAVDDNAICDICGLTENAGVHHADKDAQDELAEADDEADANDDVEHDDPDDDPDSDEDDDEDDDDQDDDDQDDPADEATVLTFSGR